MKQRKFSLWKLIAWLLVTGLVLGLIWGSLNLQYLRDSYVVRFSNQQPESMQLGSELSLTTKGLFLYKASLPKIENANQFNQSCSKVSKEHSIVLGCYAADRIYIYNVQDQRLNGAKQVTAAHELLHAVYQRLSTGDREKVDELIKEQFTEITDQRIKDIKTAYESAEPNSVPNEMFAVLGTEVANLSPKLEEVYSRYFMDRSKIVAYSQKYEAVFTELKNQSNSLKAKIEQLKSEIENLVVSIEVQKINITNDVQQMNQLRNTNTEAYNTRVPLYNARIQSYNIDVSSYKQKVVEYNQLVEKYNTLAASQNELIHKLDSKYQSLQ